MTDFILQRSFLSALTGPRVSNVKVRLQERRDFGPLMDELWAPLTGPWEYGPRQREFCVLGSVYCPNISLFKKTFVPATMLTSSVCELAHSRCAIM